ncbi:MAG: uroporphyrinogen decarboxylase family protein [Eubacteriales bacterium]|nr:uroporphyrinogen decarboxylase family protein [Eubacteriales bacterium]
MTSKQIVRAAMTFQRPERLPLDIPLLGLTDYHSANWNQIGTGDVSQKKTLDEWGCVWQRSDVKNMGLVTGHPLDSWDKLAHLRWPDPDDPSLYEGMEERIAAGGDKFIETSIFMVLFERMHALRGFQNTLEDLYLEREKIEMLADRIVEYDLRIIENISSRFPGAIDGIGFTDDWGTELNTFISPALFEEFFAPRYRRIFDACHKAGWLIKLHSCGKVNRFIQPFIDLGLDAMNLQQPRVLGIEEVGAQFAGRMCFVSLCDIQHTLPLKGKADIEEEAALLIDRWGTDNGGFILSDYGDGEAIGVPLEKKRWMLEAFLACDRWAKK